MATGVFGAAVLAAYFATVAASVLVSLLSIVLAWRLHSFPRALGYVLAGVAVLSGLATLVVAAVVGLGAGASLLGALVLVGIGLVALPLGLGWTIVARRTPTPDGVALRWTALAWPVAMVASLAWFVGASPGAIGRYDITSLDGPLGAVAFAVFFAIVWLGPGVLGVAFVRRFGRDRRSGDARPTADALREDSGRE